jgi:hypothetical protein
MYYAPVPGFFYIIICIASCISHFDARKNDFSKKKRGIMKKRNVVASGLVQPGRPQGICRLDQLCCQHLFLLPDVLPSRHMIQCGFDYPLVIECQLGKGGYGPPAGVLGIVSSLSMTGRKGLDRGGGEGGAVIVVTSGFLLF